MLYPSEDQLDSIKNDRVLERLRANRDIHEISREVDHFLYFPNPQARDAFVAAATATDFVDETAILKPQGEGQPFGLRVVSTHSVISAEIDSRTKALRILAAEFAGVYDGWGTTATSS